MTERILITGGSGFVGRQMVRFLSAQGHEVRVLGRTGGTGSFRWDPANGRLDPGAMEGVKAVIHLAGESIASGRWTRRKRERILESRKLGTRLLVSAMESMKDPPSVFVSASGVNAYGLAGNPVNEQSPYGDGFLAEVCRVWEHEAMRARNCGIRTVCVRTGIVLDKSGGVLNRMLPVFRAGLGGRIGSGRQGFPWISMPDLLRIYYRAVVDTNLEGFINAVHPQLINQAEFARTLACTLNRPVLLPVPGFLVRAILGAMGTETLLANLRVHPDVLTDMGFEFTDKTLQESLSRMLSMQFT